MQKFAALPKGSLKLFDNFLLGQYDVSVKMKGHIANLNDIFFNDLYLLAAIFFQVNLNYNTC